jgi:hypothetical protein
LARVPAQVPEELRLGGDERHGKGNVHDDRQCHFGQGHVDGMNRRVPGDHDDEQNDGDGASVAYCSPGVLSKFPAA